MTMFIEQLIAHGWNRIVASGRWTGEAGSRIDLGSLVIDGQVQHLRAYLPQSKRCEHVAVLGKTGQGKSFFLRYLSSQDIRDRSGFVFFDLHGDTMPYLLRLVAAEERRTGSPMPTD